MSVALSGHLALVTGGATGIGAATVERLTHDGAAVVCCYNRSRDNAEALAKRLGRDGAAVFTTRMDVSDPESVEGAVRAATNRFGRAIDVLINNAGDVFKTAPLEKMTPALWDTVLGVNLRGAFLCAKACIPGMKAEKWGRIINVTSISARTGGGPGSAHYAASKGGLDALTRSMAIELAPAGITVNGVAPGVIDTPIHQRINTPESLERIRRAIPLARLGDPQEIAAAISFLASDDAAYITGEIIAVNGGKRLD